MRVSQKQRMNKLKELFTPIPQGLSLEFKELDRPASDIEAWYYVVQQIRIGNHLSKRKLSRTLNTTQYRASKLLTKAYDFLDQKSPNYRPRVDHLTTSQGSSVPLLLIENDQTPTSEQPNLDQKSANIIRESKKEKRKNINYLKKPLGKRCNPELITKQVGDVWNHWFSFNEKTRTVNGECARVIKTALKDGYTVDELKLIVSWAMESEDYKWQRENGYQYCKNFFNIKKIDGNHEKAQDWSISVNAPNPAENKSVIDKAYDALSDRRYGPNGYLLPSYGGEYREAGDY